MDIQPAQPEIPTTPNVLLKPSTKFFNKTFFIPIFTLIVGFALGFFTWSILPSQKTKTALPAPSPTPAIDESKLPVSLSLLTNPIVYEWRGSVKGKLAGKNDSVFTLVDERNNSIIITNLTTGGGRFNTLFFNTIEDEQKRTTLKDIPIGSTLRGDFFIFKDGPNTPVGSLFVKE